MIDSLRKLVESLESLPPNLREEAVQQLDMIPIAGCLVDRHWSELFASTPDHVWDKNAG